MRLLIATRNAGKFREIERLFHDTSIDLVSLSDLELPSSPEEDELESGATFAENAMAKARFFAERTGLPTLAEDSGLLVDALEGAPGVETKRFAPADLQAEHGTDTANNLYLLERLRGVPDTERTARFHCAVAVVLNDESRTFEGRLDGRILREPRGSGGFGYDPLFYLSDRDCTSAELSPEEKNEISHRGRAVAAARDWLVRIAGRETSARRDR